MDVGAREIACERLVYNASCTIESTTEASELDEQYGAP